MSKLEDTSEKFKKASMTNQKNAKASIRNLETQVGQLAKQLSDQHSVQFSPNTQINPREQRKSITTRSGKLIGKDIGEHLGVEDEVLSEKEKKEIEKESEKSEIEGEVEKHKSKSVHLEKEKEKESEKRKSENRENEQKKEEDVPQLKSFPYLKNPSKKDKERQYTRFFDIFKILQINILFMEVDLEASINLMPLSMLKRIGTWKSSLLG
jgi:hypothetical protein